MKKINIAGILLIALLLPIVTAQKGNDKAGVTPDSFLWNIEKAWDHLNLALTFNPTEKAKKGLEIAKQRLEEVKVMAEENKLDAAEKAKEDQIGILSTVNESISRIKEANSTKQIEDEIELEKELENHEADVKEVSDNLKIRVEVKGTLSNEQKVILDSLLSSLENKTGEVKIEIQNKKDKTKTKIETETGKSEKEVEDEIGDIEKEKGLAGIKEGKAVEEIKDAKSDLEDLEKKLKEYNATSEVSVTSLIDNAKEKLSTAEKALNDTKYGEAFGQANAAKQLIKNAETILEKTGEHGQQEQQGQQIKVEIENNEARVKVEVGNDELRFTLNTTDMGTIIKEVSERTGLSIDEVTKIIKFKGRTEYNEEAVKEENKAEANANETEKGKEKEETNHKAEENKSKEMPETKSENPTAEEDKPKTEEPKEKENRY